MASANRYWDCSLCDENPVYIHDAAAQCTAANTAYAARFPSNTQLGMSFFFSFFLLFNSLLAKNPAYYYMLTLEVGKPYNSQLCPGMAFFAILIHRISLIFISYRHCPQKEVGVPRLLEPDLHMYGGS